MTRPIEQIKKAYKEWRERNTAPFFSDAYEAGAKAFYEKGFEDCREMAAKKADNYLRPYGGYFASKIRGLKPSFGDENIGGEE